MKHKVARGVGEYPNSDKISIKYLWILTFNFCEYFLCVW